MAEQVREDDRSLPARRGHRHGDAPACRSWSLGQQFVIENRGGTGGTIGAAATAKSASDGYTVLLYSVHGAFAASAYRNLAYDLEKDLVPDATAAIFPELKELWFGLGA